MLFEVHFNTWLIGLFILITFLIRFFPRIKLKYAFGSDTFFHLYYAKLFRKNKFKVPKTSEKVIVKHELTYPYLYHFLLGLFNEKNSLRIEKYLSPLFDTFSLIVFVAGVSYILDFEDYVFEFMLLLSVLYAFSPALLKFQGIPRAFQGSPRLFGQFLYVAHIVSFIAYDTTGELWLLYLAIFFGALVWISAKFAIQVMVFFGVIFMSFFISYALIFAGAFVFSILLSRGKVFTLIKGHVNHSKTLLKKLDISPKRNDFKLFRNHISQILKELLVFRFKKITPIFFGENYLPFNFLMYFPFFLSVFNYNSWEEFKYLNVWILSGLVIYLLTSTKKLSFLGENTRYLEFSILPAMYLSVHFLASHQLLWIIFIYLAFSIIATVYFVKNFIQKYQEAGKIHADRIALFEHINGLEYGNIFAMCSTGHPALLLSDYPVLSLFIAQLDMNVMQEEEFDLLGEHFPYPSGELEEIVKRYNIKYITLTDSEEKIYYNRYVKSKDYFCENLKLSGQFGNLKVYEVS